MENIDINGYDNVFIQYADGREERGAPMADSDDELVELFWQSTIPSNASLFWTKTPH